MKCATAFLQNGKVRLNKMKAVDITIKQLANVCKHFNLGKGCCCCPFFDNGCVFENDVPAMLSDYLEEVEVEIL